MEDFEKNRNEYVGRLEEQVMHLQRQLAETKPAAEKWTPVVTGAVDPHTQDVRITLQFGGKRVTATVPSATLTTTDHISMTSSVVDTMCDSLVKDRLREMVAPEVERLTRGARNVSGAGKW